MSNVIYVISNTVNIRSSQYKVGKHKGDQRGLINRYKTSLMDPTVFFFFPCSEASLMETDILIRLDAQRVRDMNGKKSEWIRAPLLVILSEIMPVVTRTGDRQPDYIITRGTDDEEIYLSDLYDDCYDPGYEYIPDEIWRNPPSIMENQELLDVATKKTYVWK